MRGKKHPTEKLGRKPKLESESQVPEKAPKTTATAISRIKNAPKTAINNFKKLHKNTQLAVSLTLVLILVGASTIILNRDGSNSFSSEEQPAPASFEDTAKMSGVIALKEGTLQIKDDSGEWVDAQVDAAIEQDGALRTVGATSRAVVEFEDGSELRLDANSEVVINSLTEGRIVIYHLNGYTFNRVSEQSNRSYIVETEEAQYEATGTAFKTSASGDEQSVEVYHKSVLETRTNKEPKEGEKLIVKNLMRPTENNTIIKLDIEAVKQDAFILWNRSLDLASERFNSDLGFLKDFDAPDITINTPAENETILLEPNATEGTVEISGNTERGATLTVQSKSQPGSQPVSVTVGGDGSFTTPVLVAPLGDAVFTFVIKDRVGNTAEKSLRYTFQRKSQPVTTSPSGGNIALSTTLSGENDLRVSWAFSGSIKAPDGIKIVFSKDSNPTYKDADSVPAKKGTSTTLKSNLFESETTYFIRACIYDDKKDTCSPYSNQVSIEIP